MVLVDESTVGRGRLDILVEMVGLGFAVVIDGVGAGCIATDGVHVHFGCVVVDRIGLVDRSGRGPEGRVVRARFGNGSRRVGGEPAGVVVLHGLVVSPAGAERVPAVE